MWQIVAEYDACSNQPDLLAAVTVVQNTVDAMALNAQSLHCHIGQACVSRTNCLVIICRVCCAMRCSTAVHCYIC